MRAYHIYPDGSNNPVCPLYKNVLPSDGRIEIARKYTNSYFMVEGVQ